jgi:SOS-response transcriptional repressor LexA
LQNKTAEIGISMSTLKHNYTKLSNSDIILSLSVNSQAGKDRNSQTREVVKLVIMEWFQQKCFIIYQQYFSKDVLCPRMCKNQ